MFAKLLIPTDGSYLGNLAALEGIELAAKVGAEVIGINVSREFQNPAFDFSDIRPANHPSKDEYEAAAQAAGAKLLLPLEQAAQQAGVKFSGVFRISNATARTIVQTAEEQACDLIFMGSNGCAGWDSILMGSVSNKVLNTAKVPVLIYRLQKADVPEDVPKYQQPKYTHFPGA